jgi:hypothetical protein
VRIILKYGFKRSDNLTGQVTCCAHSNEISTDVGGGVLTDQLTTTSFLTKRYTVDCLQLMQISEVPLQIKKKLIFLLLLQCTERIHKIHFRNTKYE